MKFHNSRYNGMIVDRSSIGSQLSLKNTKQKKISNSMIL